MIEQIYTLTGAAERLGMKPRTLRALVYRLGLPRRMAPNVPHSHRRVFTTSDLEVLSAHRVATYTALGHKNRSARKGTA